MMAEILFYSPYLIHPGHEIVFAGWSFQLKVCKPLYNVKDKRSVISGYMVVYETPYLTQHEADRLMLEILSDMETLYEQ